MRRVSRTPSSAFALLLFASLAGFIALVGIAFALLSAGGFAAFFYLERLLRFDVGRFG